MSEDRDQPAAEEEHVSTEETGVADEASAQGDDEPQLDEDGNPIEPEQADDDSEEVEHEGVTYKVPKALKGAFLQHADYTRKTQEVAAVRQELEARQAHLAETVQQAEAREQTLAERVQLAQLDSALEQYQGLDWDAYENEHGPSAVAKAMATWRQLETARGTVAKDISEKEAEHRLSSERATATAIQEAEQVLAKEIKGFGPELTGKAWQTAQAFGFTPAEFRNSFVGDDGKADVRSFKVFAELAELRAYKEAAEAKSKKAQTAEKVGKVTPAVTVKPNGGQYKPGLDDRLPTAEWLRRREAQVAKARGH